MRRLEHRIAAVYQARTGDHHQIAFADHGVGRVAQTDRGGLHRKLALRQRVRLEHRKHAFDTFQLHKSVIAQQSFIVDTAHDRAVSPRDTCARRPAASTCSMIRESASAESPGTVMMIIGALS